MATARIKPPAIPAIARPKVFECNPFPGLEFSGFVCVLALTLVALGFHATINNRCSRPQEPSYDVYVVTSAQVDSVNRWPSQAMLPKQYGFEEVKFEGDFGDRVFQPLQTAKFVFTDAKFGQLKLVNLMSPQVIGGDISSIMVDNTDNAVIDGVTIGKREAQTAHGVRVRVGSDNGIIQNCKVIRTGAGSDGDSHGVVFTEGPNLDWVIRHCEFGGCWTDAIQVCHVNFKTFGTAAGLTIYDCVFWSDSSLYPNGTGPSYLEQSSGIDFKDGGTQENPVIAQQCTFIGGCRSTRNPNGYQIVIQNSATDIIFRGNKFLFRGCDSAVALGPPRLNDGAPMFDRRTTFNGNRWQVTGTLVMFTDTATFENENIQCGKLEDKPVFQGRQPREFTNCKIVVGGVQQ